MTRKQLNRTNYPPAALRPTGADKLPEQVFLRDGVVKRYLVTFGDIPQRHNSNPTSNAGIGFARVV